MTSFSEITFASVLCFQSYKLLYLFIIFFVGFFWQRIKTNSFKMDYSNCNLTKYHQHNFSSIPDPHSSLTPAQRQGQYKHLDGRSLCAWPQRVQAVEQVMTFLTFYLKDRLAQDSIHVGFHNS